MGIISESQARTRLAAYEETFLGLFLEAGAAVAEVKPAALPTRRTHANMMSDKIMELVNREFPDQVTPRHYRNLLLLQSDGEPDILINFKKLKSNGMPSNYPTEASLRFHSVAPGMFEPIHLTVGYVFDETHQRVSEGRVLLQDGDRLLWSYELKQSGPIQLPLPVETETTRVKPKVTPKLKPVRKVLE